MLASHDLSDTLRWGLYWNCHPPIQRLTSPPSDRPARPPQYGSGKPETNIQDSRYEHRFSPPDRCHFENAVSNITDIQQKAPNYDDSILFLRYICRTTCLSIVLQPAYILHSDAPESGISVYGVLEPTAIRLTPRGKRKDVPRNSNEYLPSFSG